MNKWRHNQPQYRSDAGVVALITSIIVGLLLVVITTSAIALMSNELRQATDYDQSIKAYYAAEAGAEDAMAHIRRAVANNQTIDSVLSDDCATYTSSKSDLSGDNTVSYTCQIVSMASNNLTGQLDPEESAQIDLTSITDFSKLVISWNKPSAGDPSGFNPNVPLGFPRITPINKWENPAGKPLPAVIEATFIAYPRDVDFGADDIKTKTVVIKPGNTGSTVDLSTATELESAHCIPGGGVLYSCSLDFSNVDLWAETEPPSGYYYVVRLHARYASTNYQFQVRNAAGVLVKIPKTHLVIDVTGKAGDVFRRVRLQAPLTDQPFVNFVILSDEDICKVLTVTDPTAAPEDGCE